MTLSNVIVDQHVHDDGDATAPQKIQDALDRLSQNTAIAGMLSQISSALVAAGKTLTITSADIDYHGPASPSNPVFDEAMAGYVPVGSSVKYGAYQTGQTGNTAIYGGNFAIYIESRNPWTADNDSPNNSFVGTTFDGYDADFTASFDRVLFHELVHILASIEDSGSIFSGYDVPIDNRTPADTSDDFVLTYSEDIAILGENFLYVPHAIANSRSDSGMRIGHGSWADAGGVTGIDAFRDLIMNRKIESHSASLGYVEFKGDNGSDLSLSMKVYNPYNQVQAGATTFLYDHYTKYELTISPSHSSSSLFSLGYNGPLYKGAVYDVLADSLVQPVSATSPYTSLLDQAKLTMDAIRALGVVSSNPGVSSFFSKYDLMDYESDHNAGLNRMVALSAERYYQGDFLNYWDIAGPTASGKKDPAGTIAINESFASQGTLIFGGSGYTMRYEQPFNIPEQSKDSFLLSNDWITGSAHGDVIVAGTGKVSGVYNVLDGGNGDDILVGRSGNDSLLGGVGNDILIGGAGSNKVDGGIGIDILSYADSPLRMYIELSKTSSPAYASSFNQPGIPARYDTSIQNVEIVIGSSFSDEIRGRGNMLLIGGPGDDIIRLRNGDVAIGGGGNDTFILDSAGKVAILDLSSEDTLNFGSNYSNDMNYNFGPSFQSAGYGYRFAFDDQVDGNIGVLTFLQRDAGYNPNNTFSKRLEVFAPVNQAYIDSLHLNDTSATFNRYDSTYVTPSYIMANHFDLGWIV